MVGKGFGIVRLGHPPRLLLKLSSCIGTILKQKGSACIGGTCNSVCVLVRVDHQSGTWKQIKENSLPMQWPH